MSVTLVAQHSTTDHRTDENVLANESKGLTKSEPKESPRRSEGDSDSRARGEEEDPPKTQKKPPPKKSLKSDDNQIPFGQGGPVSGPYGSFSAGNAKGGLGFTGGTGDFGSRFAYYVDAVRRKVSENG